MSDGQDDQELERKLEQATRLISAASDQTTYQRIKEFVEELRQKLQRRLAARRSKEAIRARARELWEQHGRPSGRDLEFWTRAERELERKDN
jgi:Protein of unknown function (DUF2934)